MQLDAELVRRLGSSPFNYWFGYVANSTLVFWLVSHAWVADSGAPLLGHSLTLAASGLLLWTWLEYVLHRYVYHVVPTFLRQGHLMHHARPRELIGVPWWLTSMMVWGAFAGLAKVFDPGALGLVMGSCWAGYIGYCLLHHGSHHWRMQAPYLRQVKQLHQLHHAYPNYNWGFTTAIWDRIFGTYLSPAGAKKATRSSLHPRSNTRFSRFTE